MPPASLKFERLCAGSYEANASTEAKCPRPEQARPITLSTYYEAKGRSKPKRFVAIDFTNWKKRGCRLVIPAENVVFNLLDDDVVYIACDQTKRVGKMMLYIANESSIAGDFSTYTSVDTTTQRGQEQDLTETPPRIIRLKPVDLRDVTRKVIILRGCTSSSQDQQGFFKDLDRDRDPKKVQFVQKMLNLREWYWDSEIEAETIRKDAQRERRLSAKKKKGTFHMPGSSPQGEKRGADFSTDSDSNHATPSRKPPRKRHSLGLGDLPMRTQEANRRDSQNHGQHNETQRRDSDVEIEEVQDRKGGDISFYIRGSRARRGSRGGRRGASERKIVSESVHDTPRSDRVIDNQMDIFEDPPGDTTTELTSESTYQAPLSDGELLGVENLQLGPNRGSRAGGYGRECGSNPGHS